MKINKNMKNLNKRSWQGNAIGIIAVFMVMAMMYSSIKEITAVFLTFIVLQNPEVAANMLKTIPTSLAMAFTLVIILTLIARGIFSGSKLAMINIGLIMVFNFLSGVINIFKILASGNLEMLLAQAIYLIIVPGIMWMIISCLKHPFYGGNGKITLDTFKFWKKGKIVNSDDMTTF
jgi:hypothetical protein